MSENVYESFRAVLTMNLCTVTQDPGLLHDVLQMVDITMSDFDLRRKQMEIIPAADMAPVIKCYLASKAVANLSRGTLRQYKYKLDHFCSTVRKSYMDITANDIRMYLYQFKAERNISDSYVDRTSGAQGLLHKPKRREPLSPFQLETFRWNTSSIREKALIDFLYSTGCRVSECADVRLTDIDWLNRSVHIRHGKGDKERLIFFNAESEVSLRAYLKTRTDTTDALFVSLKSPHHQLQSHALEDIIKKVSRRTGIHVYPHKLRHTFATAGLRGGMPLEKLQALMGHVKPETTLIYAKQSLTDLHLEHQRAFS